MPAARPPAHGTAVPVPAAGARGDGGTRLVRGAAAASVSTAVALASHLLAGAALPGFLGVVVPLVFAVSVCTVLAGARLSALRLTLSVAVSQALFHTLFVMGTVPAGASVVPGPQDDVGLAHADHAAHGAGAVSIVESSVAGAHAAHADAQMWLAHAGAALLTVVVLHRGELLLAHLRRLASAVLAWVLPPHPGLAVQLVGPLTRPCPTVPVVLRAIDVLAACAPRRGPPARLST